MISRTCAPLQTTSTNESSKNSSSNLDQRPRQPIPSKCCIGSSSGGGQVTFKPDVCNLGPEPYRRAEEHALEYLRNNPISNQVSTAPTATSCDVCRIVDVLAQNNWTMTFQGDSTMHQLADAFDCALRRRGYRVETDEKPWRRPQGLFWRYGIGSAMRMRVWPPSSTDETSSPVIIRHYGMYRPHFGDNSSEIFHVMERSDVLVFDHSLHYTIDQDKIFSSEMTQLLQILYQKKNITSMLASREPAVVKRPNVIIWREPVSQHYDTLTGDYATVSRNAPVNCTEHPYLRSNSVHPPDKLSLYQVNMMRITQQMGLGTVNAGNMNSSSSIGKGDGMPSGSPLFVLPLTQYTRPIHYLHPGGNDCTHICYTPLLWMPVWRSLRRVVENAALSHKHQGNSHIGATYVVSEMRFMLDKTNMRSLGPFLCGVILFLRFCAIRPGLKRFLFAIGFILAIGLSAIEARDMKSVLHSLSSRYSSS